jgi:hypothetical protein
MQADLQYPIAHRISVIVSVSGLVGLLWALPVPDAFREISPLLNWGTAFVMAAIVYYFIIATALAIGMLPFAVGLAACTLRLERSHTTLELVAAIALLAGIAGLVLCRQAKGRTAALMTDIQLMMIGPVWQLSRLYKRLGIPF